MTTRWSIGALERSVVPESEVVIRLDELSVFQRKNLVLNRVNLSIRKGEFVYLIGKTGSGKSSLLKTLYAELPVLEGKAAIAGFDLTKLKRKDIPFFKKTIRDYFSGFSAYERPDSERQSGVCAKGNGLER